MDPVSSDTYNKYIYEWRFRKYKGIVDVPKTLKDIWDLVLHRNKFFYRRFDFIKDIMFDFKQPYVENTTIVFKAEMTMSDGKTISSIYGMAHTIEKNIRYTCIGPTLTSADGEYRYRFIKYHQLLNARKDYPAFFDAVDAYIMERQMSGEFNIATIVFPSAISGMSQGEWEEFANASRLAVQLISAAWLTSNISTYFKDDDNHIYPPYRKLFTGPTDIAAFEELMPRLFANIPREGHPPEELEDLNAFLISINRKLTYDLDNIRKISGSLLRVGQKIAPTKINELLRFGDINFPVWKENYISRKCADIVINAVSPAFPLTGHVFLIQDSNKLLFDNPSMHNKIDAGITANEITNDLFTANAKTHIAGTEYHLSRRFAELSRRLSSVIEFNRSYIGISDVSVCSVSEYVGRTFRDFVHYHKSPVATLTIPGKPVPKEIDPKLDILADPEVFAKVLFDYLYGLYAMYDKFSFLHSDLHLNNITVDVNGRRKRDYPHVYILDNDAFVFNAGHVAGYIIDLSRCIIGNAAVIDQDFGEEFGAHFRRTGFINQRAWIVKTLKNYLPEFIGGTSVQGGDSTTPTLEEAYSGGYEINESEVERVFERHFSTAFKAIAALDFFQVSTNILRLIKMEFSDAPNTILHKENLSMVKKIAELSETHITKNLAVIIQEVRNNRNPDTVELLSPTAIIKEVFADYNKTDKIILKKNIDEPFIDDVFSLQTGKSLKFSTGSYDILPDLAKINLELKLKEKFPDHYEGEVIDESTYKEEFKHSLPSTSAIRDDLPALAKIPENQDLEQDNSWMFE